MRLIVISLASVAAAAVLPSHLFHRTTPHRRMERVGTKEDPYKQVMSTLKRSTEDILVCMCRHLVITKDSKDPTSNPCADKYCKASYDKCAPNIAGDLELCIVEEHEECAMRWPDLSHPHNVSNFFNTMLKCFTPPSKTSTNSPPSSEAVDSSLVVADMIPFMGEEYIFRPKARHHRYQRKPHHFIDLSDRFLEEAPPYGPPLHDEYEHLHHGKVVRRPPTFHRRHVPPPPRRHHSPYFPPPPPAGRYPPADHYAPVNHEWQIPAPFGPEIALTA